MDNGLPNFVGCAIDNSAGALDVFFKRIGFSKHMDREKAHMEKVEKLLERIAAAVEQKAISKN